jgi:geranylgeranyl diphosphate synthase type II
MPLIFQDFFTYLEKQAITKEPENLYEPIAYI